MAKRISDIIHSSRNMETNSVEKVISKKGMDAGLGRMGDSLEDMTLRGEYIAGAIRRILSLGKDEMKSVRSGGGSSDAFDSAVAVISDKLEEFLISIGTFMGTTNAIGYARADAARMGHDESVAVTMRRLLERVERMEPETIGPGNMRAHGIMGFVKKFEPFEELLWEIGADKTSAGYNFLRLNPEMRKKYEALSDAYKDFRKAAMNTAKYLDVKFTRNDPRALRGESVDLAEAITMDGMTFTFDRVIDKLETLNGRFKPKYFGDERKKLGSVIRGFIGRLDKLAGELEK